MAFKKEESKTNYNYIDSLRYVDETSSVYIRTLFYGESGVGKTRLVGTFPKPFVIDTDGGLRTLKEMHVPYKSYRRGDRKVYREILNILTDAAERKGPFAPDGPLGDRETMVIDGWTSLADVLLFEAMKGGVGVVVDPSSAKPEWEHYGALKVRLQLISDKLSELEMHVATTCNVRLDRDEKTGGYVGQPDIVGGFRSEILRDFDEVYFLTAKRKRTDDKDVVEYRAYTRPYGYYVAKSRDDIPEDVIRNPTFEKLYSSKKV